MKLLAWLLFFAAVASVRAQVRESALSEVEVEVLREKAPEPAERVLAFVGFLNDRTKAIEKLLLGRRKPGREDDIHDLMEQFSSIANDLQDNLDDYDKHHKDVRKALPKLLVATERWGTALRSPADESAYNVSRKLALDALADVKASTSEMIKAQQEYFLAHPPPRDTGPGRPDERRGPTR